MGGSLAFVWGGAPAQKEPRSSCKGPNLKIIKLGFHPRTKPTCPRGGSLNCRLESDSAARAREKGSHHAFRNSVRSELMRRDIQMCHTYVHNVELLHPEVKHVTPHRRDGHIHTLPDSFVSSRSPACRWSGSRSPRPSVSEGSARTCRRRPCPQPASSTGSPGQGS